MDSPSAVFPLLESIFLAPPTPFSDPFLPHQKERQGPFSKSFFLTAGHCLGALGCL